jgi:hypothetical protein
VKEYNELLEAEPSVRDKYVRGKRAYRAVPSFAWGRDSFVVCVVLTFGGGTGSWA